MTDAIQRFDGETLKSVGRPLARAAATITLVRNLAPHSVIKTFKQNVKIIGEALDVSVWDLRIGHEDILSDLVLGLQNSSAPGSRACDVLLDDEEASPGLKDCDFGTIYRARYYAIQLSPSQVPNVLKVGQGGTLTSCGA